MKYSEKCLICYDKLVKQTLSKNKKQIIESFVLYYGENYRSLIEKKYEEINFICYINWQELKKIVEYFIPEQRNKKKYEPIIKLYKLLLKKNIKENILVSIKNPCIINKRNIKNIIEKFTDEIDATTLFFINKSNEYKISVESVITFQLFSMSESDLIHEINHVIMESVPMYLENNSKDIFIEKNGLLLSNNRNELLINELLNEKVALEIYKTFKHIGGNLSPICLSANYGSYYQDNFFFVDEFYDTFKGNIKEALITLNKNTLIQRIGQDNYQELIELINGYYSNEALLIEIRQNYLINRIHEIIMNMKNHAKRVHELSTEEIIDYLDYLKKEGKKISLIKK